MDTRDIPAIDVHCHYGNYDGTYDPAAGLCADSEAVVLGRMAACNICCAIVSPLAAFFPRGGKGQLEANTGNAAVVARHEALFQWAVVNPLLPETYTQAEALLHSPKCLGVKIHPEEHIYPIREYGAELFEWAAKHGVVLQSHSGEEYSDPLDFVPFADQYPQVKLILSHIGCGWDGDLTKQVRAVQAAKHGNVYTDTSSAKNMMPGLIEWAVQEIGSGHVLFGSDAPLYFTAMQRARIDMAEMPMEDKHNVLYRTACGLFGGALAARYDEIVQPTRYSAGVQ